MREKHTAPVKPLYTTALMYKTILILLLAFVITVPVAAAPKWQLLEYPELGSPPNAKAWDPGDLDWDPPAELGWKKSDSGVIVMLAARFEFDGSAEQLIANFGKISQLPGTPYWSATRQKWRPLITQAYALSATDKHAKRDDFSLEELLSREPLYFFQEEETPAKEVIYQLVTSASQKRVLISAENAVPVTRLGLTLFDTGKYQHAYILEQESVGRWRYYYIARAKTDLDFLISGHHASYMNRADALYRVVAVNLADAPQPIALTKE